MRPVDAPADGQLLHARDTRTTYIVTGWTDEYGGMIEARRARATDTDGVLLIPLDRYTDGRLVDVDRIVE